MLSQQLHNLEEYGMIHREVIPDKPQKHYTPLPHLGGALFRYWTSCVIGAQIF